MKPSIVFKWFLVLLCCVCAFIGGYTLSNKVNDGIIRFLANQVRACQQST